MSSKKPVNHLIARSLALLRPGGKIFEIGPGRELIAATYLAKKGYRVSVLDKDEEVLKRIKKLNAKNLRGNTGRIEELKLLPSNYDAIIAINVLSFAGPHKFDDIVKKLIASLKQKGVFCITFFGPNDDWSDRDDIAIKTMLDVKKLLKKDMEIHYQSEVESNGPTMKGNMKHWHVLSIIATKNPSAIKR